LFPVLLLPGQRPIERAFHADPVRSVCSSRLTPRSAQQAIWRTSSDTISVTDDEGITLSFGSPPGRIVSLLPAATEILFALDAGDRLVGRTRFDSHPPEVLDVPSVGDGVRPSVEMIMARQPDLVIVFSGPDSRAAADALRRVGISVLAVRHNTLEDLYRNIDRLGRVAKKEAAATKLSASIARDLLRTRQVTEQLPQRSVYYDAWWHPPITIGGGSYLDSLITLAGGRNVFGDQEGPSPQVSLEAIAARRPEIVLYPVHRGVEKRAPIRDRPGWEVLSAVREDRVREFNGELVVRLGPRIGAAVRELAAAIHPTVFFMRAPSAAPDRP
jgi:ABC-type Fe3+-hydroxamate transport system substrate-binding protein